MSHSSGSACVLLPHDEDATRQQLQAAVDSVLDITTPYGKLVETEAEANV